MTLYQKLIKAGACPDKAKRYKGKTLKQAFRIAEFWELRWYIRQVLRDFDYPVWAYDEAVSSGTNILTLIRNRIIRAHPRQLHN